MQNSISRESLDTYSFSFVMHGIKYREAKRIQNLKLENSALVLLLAGCAAFRKLPQSRGCSRLGNREGTARSRACAELRE